MSPLMLKTMRTPTEGVPTLSCSQGSLPVGSVTPEVFPTVIMFLGYLEYEFYTAE